MPKTKIFFIDNPDGLENIPDGNGALKYLVLDENPDAERIRGLLKKDGRWQEVDARSIIEKKFPAFREEYIKYIGRLNIANAGLLWWAYFFTNKNPIASHLFYDIVKFLIIKESLEEGPDHLVIITTRRILFDVLSEDDRSEHLCITNLMRSRAYPAGLSAVLAPFLMMLKFLRSVYFKILSIFLIGPRARTIDRHKSRLVLRTTVTEISLSNYGPYRDIYFGELAEYFIDNDIPFFVAATISGNYFRTLRRIQAMDSRVVIVPMEYWTSWGAMLKTLFVSLKSCFFPFMVAGDTRIYGIDMRRLIDSSMKEDIGSTSFFSHIESYYSAESMSKKYEIAKVIYPMENRPWETLMIRGMRSSRPDCRITGYQHASISPKHMNFIFIDGEISVMPFPDEIITMGDVTRELLIEKGNVPEAIIRPGCALRQADSFGSIRKKPAAISKVLVALASNIDEYLRTFLMLEGVSGASGRFKIRVRPHPTIPIDPILEYLKKGGLEFELSGPTSIKDDLAWCDLLVYVSATVSIEAMASGIPVVYLDVDPVLKRDPLNGIEALKWSARNPSDIERILKDIALMQQEEYSKRQETAVAFARKYITPVNEECLKRFLS